MGRKEGGLRPSVVRPSVVCEYDYISIDACIVQFGRGMATGVTSTTCARSCTGTLHFKVPTHHSNGYRAS